MKQNRKETIKILTVIILIVSSYFLGKLSMKEQLLVLSERMYQMEIQIEQLKQDD